MTQKRHIFVTYTDLRGFESESKQVVKQCIAIDQAMHLPAALLLAQLYSPR